MNICEKVVSIKVTGKQTFIQKLRVEYKYCPFKMTRASMNIWFCLHIVYFSLKEQSKASVIETYSPQQFFLYKIVFV